MESTDQSSNLLPIAPVGIKIQLSNHLGKSGGKKSLPKKMDISSSSSILSGGTFSYVDSDDEDIDTSNLVIPLPDSGISCDNVDKNAPMLLRSIPQKLLEIDDENARFKTDLSLRPDDVDVRSHTYKSVPVEKFGEALLRGMGWSGPTADDEKRMKSQSAPIIPRESRRGLGASLKPPEKGQNKIINEIRQEEWKGKMEQRLKSQVLDVGDIVFIQDPSLFGKRAEIIQVRGVPGLDRIKISLENSGDLFEIPKSKLIKISQIELDKSPFQFCTSKVEHSVSASPEYFGLKNQKKNDVCVREAESDSSNHKRRRDEYTQSHDSHKDSRHSHDRDGRRVDDQRDKYDRKEKIDRNDRSSQPKIESKAERNDNSNSNRNSSSNSNNSSSGSCVSVKKGDSTVNRSSSRWLREGIRVRLISKKFGDSRYLQKGCVVDVYGDNQCSVKLDNGSVVESVKSSHLETVLPAVGQFGLLLLGEHKGEKATLLEKRKASDTVLVQLVDDLEVLEVPMEEIAAYAP